MSMHCAFFGITEHVLHNIYVCNKKFLQPSQIKPFEKLQVVKMTNTYSRKNLCVEQFQLSSSL